MYLNFDFQGCFKGWSWKSHNRNHFLDGGFKVGRSQTLEQEKMTTRSLNRPIRVEEMLSKLDYDSMLNFFDLKQMNLDNKIPEEWRYGKTYFLGSLLLHPWGYEHYLFIKKDDDGQYTCGSTATIALYFGEDDYVAMEVRE